MAAGRDEATGRGAAPDAAAPGSVYAFDFRARALSSSGAGATGRFRLADRAAGWEIRGEVICLKLVSSIRAVGAGTVTYAAGSGIGGQLLPGDSFLFFAEDHGHRRGADAFSPFAFHDPAPSTALCDASESGPAAISRGQITVRDR
jgi:hypothetical protein